MANFWYVLLSHPDVLGAVRRDPALLDAAFTEFMRRDGVVVYEDRELIRDVELHGREIKAGEIVRVALISANNDETAFADPRRFDPRRADLHPGKESRSGGRREGVASHVGFGVGKHFCIGYQLARAEVVVGVGQLLDRLHGPGGRTGPRTRSTEPTHPRRLASGRRRGRGTGRRATGAPTRTRSEPGGPRLPATRRPPRAPGGSTSRGRATRRRAGGHGRWQARDRLPASEPGRAPHPDGSRRRAGGTSSCRCRSARAPREHRARRPSDLS